MTPVLRELHRLPVRQKIRFKTAVMMYKCIHGLAPSYLAALCKPTSSCPGQSNRRSATSRQLNFPRMKTDYGKRSFAVNGPVVWNSLPTELLSPDISLDVLKVKLKTFLFNCWLSTFCVFILILHSPNNLKNKSALRSPYETGRPSVGCRLY